jgi:methylamine---corrinoid protein Co-methyltransferase
MRDKYKVDYEYFLSVLDKSENGPIIDEKEWDRHYINKSVKELVAKYDISWDKANVAVPADDALADRLFEAGMEMVLNSGVYCIDTHRRMIWDKEELEKVLQNIPDEVVIGQGDDAVLVKKRNPDENSRVAVIGGGYGNPIVEELFVPLTISYAKEPLLDFIDNATLATTHGRTIRAKSPWDSVACWQEAELGLKALAAAGRPGMCMGGPNSTASSIGVLTAVSYRGFRPTDWNHNSFLCELKVSYEDLIKSSHYLHTDSYCHNFYNPIFGGYAGGGEGLAVIMVAGMILLRACLHGDTFNPGPIHAHLSCSTYPEIITSKALALQALNRNTKMMTSSFSRPIAGPGEMDIFYETAAMQIAGVTSGVALVKGPQSAMGRFEGHCSPLEGRFMAQVSHAAEKLNRKEADPIVKKLFNKYQDGLKEMKSGKHFRDVYNLDKLEPTPEWMGMYEKACSEMVEMGLPLLEPLEV